MMQLPNGSGWPWRWTKKKCKTGEDVATTQPMLALIKGVVDDRGLSCAVVSSASSGTSVLLYGALGSL